MPRKKFLASNEFPYHVTGRSLNKDWFALPLEDLWSVFSNYLYFLHHGFGFRIYSFVLMQNHFHLIVRTPESNLSSGMNYFMRETSRVIGRQSRRINQVYGGPYYWSLIKSPIYFLHAYKYVYRNPLEAGLAISVESYRYSTLYSLTGQAHSIIPLDYDSTLFDDPAEQIRWLNTSYSSPSIKIDIKNALRKREFHFAKTRNGKPHPLDLTRV